MKVLVTIPVYKRPEVFFECLANWKNPPSKLRIELVFCFILSNSDEFYNQNLTTATNFLRESNHEGVVIEKNNKPLATKINAGLQIMMAYKWDYLMNFGSDNILSDDYWVNFYPKMYDNNRLIAMNSLVIVDCYTKQAILCKYPIIGAGRLIRRDLIEETMSELGYLYTPRMNSGLDTSSMKNIQSIRDVVPEIVNGCYVIDLKTTTNINLFWELKDKIHEPTEVNADELAQFGEISALCTRIANKGRIL